ncbi:exported hypothetical protein [Candidatus Methanoperedens nitroreducens]|uniref:Uncharacterized protein n=2 Tax=Candidatus Methanoperedens nitratireducens TaxID=1392998 RepID=A0A284VJE7_9EURY|nr:exported hypothetical protein [Candidatus Methanoperedens nitroreducens]
MDIHKYMFLVFIFFLLFLSITVVPNYAAPVARIHDDNVSGNLTDPECRVCHVTKKAEVSQPEKHQNDKKPLNTKKVTIETISIQSLGSNSMPGNNYTAILKIGQTPYQLGAFYRTEGATGWPRPEGYNGWSWWDTDNYGTEKQKNLIAVMVLDNSTGTVKPVPGLITRPAWPQASYRKYSGTYSFKADTDPAPIATLNNYADQMDIWMIKEVDLTGVTNANLTFMTWYSMETDWDYGYVAVSTNGNSWINLPGTLTTIADPNGNNLGNGITGSSNGWVQETMDLTPYTGNRILLGFRFQSDAYVNEEGWYVDDINVTSGMISILSDDAETSRVTRTLTVNVTYPHLSFINKTDPLTNATTLQYTQNTQQVNLQEDISHPGTYIGYFVYDPFAEQYSGNYTVTLDTAINSSPIQATAQFQTTLFGCQSCHNKNTDGSETSFIHGDGGGMWSCSYICHTGSRGTYGIGLPSLSLNPMHVHEMRYGHTGGFLQGTGYPQPPYNIPAHAPNITCTQCHTSFIHDNTGTDTSKIANYTLYGTNISFSSGTHTNLSCENCHGTLNYPVIPQNQYQLEGTLGNYNPTFTSHKSFTDTYVISVNGTENLVITITGSNTTKSIELYVIGPVDNTTTALQGTCNSDGGCDITQSLATPINLDIINPYTGTWLVKLTQLQEGEVNYTITSNYPVQKKPIIQIPECSDCHNPSAIGNAYTRYDIPAWNPGFAHADVNGDGARDIQCRMCHDPMHEITVKGCRNCHTTAPVNHPVAEPQFSQYTINQCLACHGDPHNVSVTGGDTCIECHGTNYTGENPVAVTTLVNISAFNESIHQEINATPPDTLNNIDCWSCHYYKDMNRQNVKKCGECHRKPAQWHGNADVTTNLSELW